MTVQSTSLKGLALLAEIDRLKRDRNAVILAHYYQKPEIQDLADFVGDSLDLSRKAAATDADVIAFCGVRFMAETAKILSPEKTVILPDMDAGCSLEDSCPPDQIAAFHWTKVDPPDGDTGEVYVVGVSPDRQGEGLGKTVTILGLDHLRARGLRDVVLYVDEDNVAAVRTYAGLGFADREVHRQYARRP